MQILGVTVSPVEKLTNRTTGTLPVRSRYGHGTVAVRSRFSRGTVEVRLRSTVEVRLRSTVMVRSRYGRGAVEEYGRGTVKVRSRYGRGTVEVRSRCVRYSLGKLPVRSLYGILKVRSCLVFSTRLEPGTRTVHFIVRIAQSRLDGFGSAIDTIPLIRNV